MRDNKKSKSQAPSPAKLLISIVCIPLFFFAEKSQNIDRRIDELEKKLAMSSGMGKIDLLNELSYKFYNISPKKSLEYGQKALTLSQKIAYKKGEASAYYHISWANIGMGNYNEALNRIQQSLFIQKKLKDKTGISKTLNTMGNIQRSIGNYKKALEIHLQTLEIKKEIGDKKELAISYMSIGNVYTRWSKYQDAETNYIKSLSIFTELNHHLGMANCLNNIGLVYDNRSNYQKALLYYRKALNIRIKMGDQKGIGGSYNNLGNISKNLCNYSDALDFYLKSLRIREEMDDKRGQAEALHNSGLVYNHMGDYAKALDFFQTAMKIEEKIGNKMGIADSLNSIGDTYESQNDTSQALTHYKKALKIYKKIDNKWGIAISLNDIGWMNDKMNRNQEALAFYQQSKKISEEIGNKQGIADSLKYQAEIHKKTGKAQKALVFLKKSLVLFEEIGDKQGMASCMTDIGDVYIFQKEYKKALDYLIRGLNLAKKIEAKTIIRKNFSYTSKLYEVIGNFKESLVYHKSYHQADKDIYNTETSQRLTNLRVRYDVDKKKEKIEKLEKENKIRELQLSRANLMRNASILSLILVSIILILLFHKYLYLFSFWKKQKYVGQYRLLDKIGAGAMGTIFRAHNIKNKTDEVAIKILKEELFQNRESRKRFEREAEIVYSLDHPHIVKIRDRGQYKDTMYIAMELFDGITLAEKINQDKRLEPDVSSHILRQISDALVFIHSQGIIHRDLKPGNIILTHNKGDHSYVKLLDFGISQSKEQTRLTASGNIVGTTRYMSPEQFTKKEISPKSDVYSLGIILYEMLTGASPYLSNTTFSLQKEIQEKDFRNLIKMTPQISQDMKKLMLQMLEKDPKKRVSAKYILDELTSRGLF